VLPEGVPAKSHGTPEDAHPAVGATGRFHQSGNAAVFPIVRLATLCVPGACVDARVAGDTEITGAPLEE
jgi:hypothetical protein